MSIALAVLILLGTPHAQPRPATGLQQDAKDDSRAWLSNAPWLSDFEEAARQAQATKKLILAYFPSREWVGFNDRFEASTLSNKKFPNFARDYVLLVQDRTGTLDGLPPGARAAEEPSQSILFLDAEGWAVGRPDASTDRTPPLISRLESMAKEARQRGALHERATKGDLRARQEWLKWIGGSGQLTDMEAASAELDTLAIPASSSLRDEIEVAVIINVAQVSAHTSLQKASKEVKSSTGTKLLPYFARGYRPADDARDWSYLWSLLQGAEDNRDAALYAKLVAALKKKGACGTAREDMEATLARLKRESH